MKMDVANIAKLANLPITDAEKEKFEKQLSSILTYIEKLAEVNTKNIEPTSQVTGLENVERDDISVDSLSQEEATSDTKSKHNEFFKVPAVLENDL